MAWSDALGPLLERQIALYTMGDHSSLPVETAEALILSIAFTLEQGQGATEELMTADPEAALARGRQALAQEITRGKSLLRAAGEGAPPFAGRAYRETLRALGGFFRAYDYRYFALEIPCLIDYQLAHAITGSQYQGVVYVNEYLRCLICENAICARFDPVCAAALLKRTDSAYQEEVSNLYAPIAECAIALTLLDGDIHSLTVTPPQRATLRALLLAGGSLTTAAERLGRALELDEAQCAYLGRTAAALERRVLSALDET